MPSSRENFNGFIAKFWPEVLYWCLMFLKLLTTATARIHSILSHLCRHLEEYQRTVAQNVLENTPAVSQNETSQEVSLFMIDLPGHDIPFLKRAFIHVNPGSSSKTVRMHFNPRVWYFIMFLVQELKGKFGSTSESESGYCSRLVKMKRLILRELESTTSGIALQIYLYHRHCLGETSETITTLVSVLFVDECEIFDGSSTTAKELSTKTGDVKLYQEIRFDFNIEAYTSFNSNSFCDGTDFNVCGLQVETCSNDLLTVGAAEDSSTSTDIVDSSAANDIENTSCINDIADTSTVSDVIDTTVIDFVNSSETSDIVDETCTSDIADTSVASNIADLSFASDIIDTLEAGDITNGNCASDIADASPDEDIADTATHDIADVSTKSDILDTSDVRDIAHASASIDIAPCSSNIVDASHVNNIADSSCTSDIADTSSASDIVITFTPIDNANVSDASDYLHASSYSNVVDSAICDNFGSSVTGYNKHASHISVTDMSESASATLYVSNKDVPFIGYTPNNSDAINNIPREANDIQDASVDNSSHDDVYHLSELGKDERASGVEVSESSCVGHVRHDIGDDKKDYTISCKVEIGNVTYDLISSERPRTLDSSSMQNSLAVIDLNAQDVVGDIKVCQGVVDVLSSEANDMQDTLSANTVNLATNVDVKQDMDVSDIHGASNVNYKQEAGVLEDDVLAARVDRDMEITSIVDDLHYTTTVEAITEKNNIVPSDVQSILDTSNVPNSSEDNKIDITNNLDITNLSLSFDNSSFQTGSVEGDLLLNTSNNKLNNFDTKEVKNELENESLHRTLDEAEDIETMISVYLNDDILNISEELPENIFDTDDDELEFSSPIFTEGISCNKNLLELDEANSIYELNVQSGPQLLGNVAMDVTSNNKSGQIFESVSTFQNTKSAESLEISKTFTDLSEVISQDKFGDCKIVPTSRIKDQSKEVACVSDAAKEINVNAPSSSLKSTERKVFNPWEFLNDTNISEENYQQYEIQSCTAEESEIRKMVCERLYDFDQFANYRIFGVPSKDSTIPCPSNSSGASNSAGGLFNKIAIDIDDEVALQLLRPSENYRHDEEYNFKTLVHFALLGEIAVSASEDYWLSCCWEYTKRHRLQSDKPAFHSLFPCILDFLADFCHDNFGFRKEDYEMTIYILSLVKSRHFAVDFYKIVENPTKGNALNYHPELPDHFSSFLPIHSWEMHCPDSSIVPYNTWELQCPVTSNNEKWLSTSGFHGKTFEHPLPIKNLYSNSFKFKINLISLPISVQKQVKRVKPDISSYDWVDVAIPDLTPEQVTAEISGLIFMFCTFWRQRELRCVSQKRPQASIEHGFSLYQRSTPSPSRPKTFGITDRKLKMQREREALVGDDVWILPVSKISDKKKHQLDYTHSNGRAEKTRELDFAAVRSKLRIFQQWKKKNPNSLIVLGSVIIKENNMKTPLICNMDEKIDIRKWIKYIERMWIDDAVLIACGQAEADGVSHVILKEVSKHTKEIMAEMLDRDKSNINVVADNSGLPLANAAESEGNKFNERWTFEDISVEVTQKTVVPIEGSKEDLKSEIEIEVHNRTVFNTGKKNIKLKKWSNQRGISRDDEYRLRLIERNKNKKAANEVTQTSDTQEAQTSQTQNEIDYQIDRALDFIEGDVSKDTVVKQNGCCISQKPNKKARNKSKKKNKNTKNPVEEVADGTETVCKESDVSKAEEDGCQDNQTINNVPDEVKLDSTNIDHQEKQTTESIESPSAKNVGIDLEAASSNNSEIQEPEICDGKDAKHMLTDIDNDTDCKRKLNTNKEADCDVIDLLDTSVYKNAENQGKKSHKDSDYKIETLKKDKQKEASVTDDKRTNIKQEIDKNNVPIRLREYHSKPSKPQRGGIGRNRQWNNITYEKNILDTYEKNRQNSVMVDQQNQNVINVDQRNNKQQRELECSNKNFPAASMQTSLVDSNETKKDVSLDDTINNVQEQFPSYADILRNKKAKKNKCPKKHSTTTPLRKEFKTTRYADKTLRTEYTAESLSTESDDIKESTGCKGIRHDIVQNSPKTDPVLSIVDHKSSITEETEILPVELLSNIQDIDAARNGKESLEKKNPDPVLQVEKNQNATDNHTYNDQIKESVRKNESKHSTVADLTITDPILSPKRQNLIVEAESSMQFIDEDVLQKENLKKNVVDPILQAEKNQTACSYSIEGKETKQSEHQTQARPNSSTAAPKSSFVACKSSFVASKSSIATPKSSIPTPKPSIATPKPSIATPKPTSAPNSSNVFSLTSMAATPLSSPSTAPSVAGANLLDNRRSPIAPSNKSIAAPHSMEMALAMAMPLNGNNTQWIPKLITNQHSMASSQSSMASPNSSIATPNSSIASPNASMATGTSNRQAEPEIRSLVIDTAGLQKGSLINYFPNESPQSYGNQRPSSSFFFDGCEVKKDAKPNLVQPIGPPRSVKRPPSHRQTLTVAERLSRAFEERRQTENLGMENAFNPAQLRDEDSNSTRTSSRSSRNTNLPETSNLKPLTD